MGRSSPLLTQNLPPSLWSSDPESFCQHLWALMCRNPPGPQRASVTCLTPLVLCLLSARAERLTTSQMLLLETL